MPYLILILLKIEFFNLDLKESTVRNTGCLPFSWDYQSVDGLGEWYAKFRTGTFRPGIAAFTFLYNSFPFIKKQLRRPESGIKDGLKK